MSASFQRSVPRVGISFPSLAAAVLLSACGDSGGSATMADVLFKDANNYTSNTTLTIPKVATAPGADLMVCWNGISKDLLCHDIVPATDIDNVSFLQIVGMSQAEVQNKLAVGTLEDNDVRVYGDFHTENAAGSTCAMLSTFKLGSDIIDPATDYAAATDRTYMLLFETGTMPGIGSRSMLFLEPTAGSTVTTVNAIDACSAGVLDFEATLGQPMPISATDNTKWDVDWSGLTKDSFGTPLSGSLFSKIDRVLIGFYQGMTAAQLQASFIDIEIVATTLYEVSVPPGARHVDLAKATVRGATTPFPGFDRTDGVWAMAVTCSRCQVPAPILMSILQPE